MSRQMKEAIDMTGEKHGRLTVVERAGTNKDNRATWRCICDCGNQVTKSRPYINRSSNPSCGCAFKEMVAKRGKNNKTHGDTDSRLYTIWKGMRYRCKNKEDAAYEYYGGRGIDVVDEWNDSYRVFKEWAEANGYSEELSIDRVDNDKGYSPENCRWTDITTQNRNRSNSVRVKLNGVSVSVKEASEATGINEWTIRYRHNNGLKIDAPVNEVEGSE